MTTVPKPRLDDPVPAELVRQIARALECLRDEDGPRTIVVALYTNASGALRRWEVKPVLSGSPRRRHEDQPPSHLTALQEKA